MMIGSKIRTGLLGLAGALTLSGCVYDGYGYGGVGVGAGYYDDGYYAGDYYGDGYYDGSYYGGYPLYGWYDGYYYPGSGYYVYDRGGRRHQWRDSDRRHWEGRRAEASRRGWRGDDGRDRADRGRVAPRTDRREAQAQARGWRGGDRDAPRAAPAPRSGNVAQAERRGFRSGDSDRSARSAPRSRSEGARSSGNSRSGQASSRGWRSRDR